MYTDPDIFLNTIMDSSRILNLFIIHSILIHLYTVTLSQPDFLYHICLGSGNYTMNSAYNENLNNLLSSLATNETNSLDYGFYYNSTGQNTDTVNAIALCRGDVTPDVCHSCVKNSTTKLTQLCPNQKEAVAWYDECMLRYSNRSILGTVSGAAFYMWNPGNASNVDEFNQVLGDLLTKLKTRAASGGYLRKFATEDASFANFGRVYALVQCTPDLSLTQCTNCLSDAIDDIPQSSLYGKQAGRVLGANCNFRYENYLFYNTNVDAPLPSTTPNLSPQPPPTQLHLNHLR